MSGSSPVPVPLDSTEDIEMADKPQLTEEDIQNGVQQFGTRLRSAVVSQDVFNQEWPGLVDELASVLEDAADVGASLTTLGLAGAILDTWADAQINKMMPDFNVTVEVIAQYDRSSSSISGSQANPPDNHGHKSTLEGNSPASMNGSSTLNEANGQRQNLDGQSSEEPSRNATPATSAAMQQPTAPLTAAQEGVTEAGLNPVGQNPGKRRASDQDDDEPTGMSGRKRGRRQCSEPFVQDNSDMEDIEEGIDAANSRQGVPTTSEDDSYTEENDGMESDTDGDYDYKYDSDDMAQHANNQWHASQIVVVAATVPCQKCRKSRFRCYDFQNLAKKSCRRCSRLKSGCTSVQCKRKEQEEAKMAAKAHNAKIDKNLPPLKRAQSRVKTDNASTKRARSTSRPPSVKPQPARKRAPSAVPTPGPSNGGRIGRRSRDIDDWMYETHEDLDDLRKSVQGLSSQVTTMGNFCKQRIEKVEARQNHLEKRQDAVDSGIQTLITGLPNAIRQALKPLPIFQQSHLPHQPYYWPSQPPVLGPGATTPFQSNMHRPQTLSPAEVNKLYAHDPYRTETQQYLRLDDQHMDSAGVGGSESTSKLYTPIEVFAVPPLFLPESGGIWWNMRPFRWNILPKFGNFLKKGQIPRFHWNGDRNATGVEWLEWNNQIPVPFHRIPVPFHWIPVIPTGIGGAQQSTAPIHCRLRTLSQTEGSHAQMAIVDDITPTIRDFDMAASSRSILEDARARELQSSGASNLDDAPLNAGQPSIHNPTREPEDVQANASPPSGPPSTCPISMTANQASAVVVGTATVSSGPLTGHMDTNMQMAPLIPDFQIIQTAPPSSSAAPEPERKETDVEPSHANPASGSTASEAPAAANSGNERMDIDAGTPGPPSLEGGALEQRNDRDSTSESMDIDPLPVIQRSELTKKDGDTAVEDTIGDDGSQVGNPPAIQQVGIVQSLSRTQSQEVGTIPRAAGSALSVRFFDILGCIWTGLGLGLCPWGPKDRTGPDFKTLACTLGPPSASTSSQPAGLVNPLSISTGPPEATCHVHQHSASVGSQQDATDVRATDHDPSQGSTAGPVPSGVQTGNINSRAASLSTVFPSQELAPQSTALTTITPSLLPAAPAVVASIAQPITPVRHNILSSKTAWSPGSAAPLSPTSTLTDPPSSPPRLATIRRGRSASAAPALAPTRVLPSRSAKKPPSRSD
ncbi:hypothetical protein BDZ97DRAFT_1928341 [Flammula alnicola]|nr:hypothetical protein BDZ97DRAFT_1928341 [Flammula alnicola]